MTSRAITPPALLRPSFGRRLLANRSFVIGVVLVGLVALAALLAPWIAPFDPLKGAFRARMAPPKAGDRIR